MVWRKGKSASQSDPKKQSSSSSVRPNTVSPRRTQTLAPVELRPLWDALTIHDVLLQCSDYAYRQLRADQSFNADWAAARTVAGTRTTVRQAVLMGKGTPGRTLGAFWMLAEEYIKRAEQARGISSQVPLQKRCVFERGLDFGFYNGGGLDDGRKRLLVAAQVVSNPAELLGRFSELLLAKCRVKYFFVDVDAVPDALARITAYCQDAANEAVDWADTTYWLAEIPPVPKSPNHWAMKRAEVGQNGSKINFC